jgi:catechol 2,3-dioxygenase-like lactoylglutathione lyase family enzyme
MAESYPRIAQVVLDTTDARTLAEFYRQLFGLEYRAGDEPPAPSQPDPQGSDWLVLRNPHGGPQLAFQQTDGVRPSTWPDAAVPQMLHLDTVVATRDELQIHRDRALALGATELLDRTDDQNEPLYVFADPGGHPFCIFVDDPRIKRQRPAWQSRRAQSLPC